MSRKFREFLIISCSVTLLKAQPQSPSLIDHRLDWNQITTETTKILQDLLRINTTNPPGNELAAAKYFQELLSREGIPSEILEAAPGRGSIIARLKGNGTKRPLLLMGHLDVVGVEKEMWSVDPFGGVIKGGILYGRGALDDKSMCAAEAAVMLLLKRNNIKLSRDVIFLAESDEESSGEHGMVWLVDHHLAKINAEFAINEGGRIVKKHGEVQYVGVQNTEKQYYDIKLTAEGTAGHASIPKPDNAIYRLARALERLSHYTAPVKLNSTTRAFFKGLATVEHDPLSFYMENLETPGLADSATREVSKILEYSSMLRNSISPTLLNAGIRVNVIPNRAEANLNCRLVPGEKVENFINEMRRVIADDEIKIEYERPLVAEPEASSFENDIFQAVSHVAKEMYPNAVTVPYMSTGATDSRALRAKGMQAYGLLPFPIDPEDIMLMHGNDERISLDSFKKGIQLLYAVTVDVAK